MSVFFALLSIVILVILITRFKFNTFLAFLLCSILAAVLLGMTEPAQIAGALQKGIGDMLGGLVMVIAAGAMLGKIVAESGAAQRIASGMMKLFGPRYIQWALMVTGFMIGIPLFYNVGFVLVIPLIFSVAYQFKFPAVYVGMPMLASLSVTHGFLPPHPSPFFLVQEFHADMGTTLWYGILIAVPTVILAGPVFSQTLKKIDKPVLKTFRVDPIPEERLPSLLNSIFTSLLPLILLGITTLLSFRVAGDESAPLLILKTIVRLANDPSMIMLFSVLIASYTLGTRMGMKLKQVMDIYGEAVKDIAMLLLIMGGAGALKQVFVASGVSEDIGRLLSGSSIHPLLFGWTLAAVVRVCVGSATVAGITTAGIVAPLLDQLNTNANLLVLAIGAGSLMFSHVNDAGFWLFKEYFNLSIKETIRSWSFMETIVSLCGLVGVMILSIVV